MRRLLDHQGRTIVALSILLCGVALLSQFPLLAGTVSWQRYADAYEDIVVVTRAEWRDSDNELRVRATTSSGADAVLSVYETGTGQRIGAMSHQGGDEHRGEFAWPRNPVVITVRSSLGGEATVLVTGDFPPTVTSTAPTATSAGVTPTATQGNVTPSATSTHMTPPSSTGTPTTTTTATPTATNPPWIDWAYLPRNLKP